MKFFKKPEPDATSFRKVLLKEKLPEKVHSFEFSIAHLPKICRNMLQRDWVDFSECPEAQKKYWNNVIDVHYKLGYDVFSVVVNLGFPVESKGTLPESKIMSWKDFDEYPWPVVTDSTLASLEYIIRNLPDGMEVFVTPAAGFFGTPRNALLGYENMSLMFFDNPELAEAVFNKVGEIIINAYKKVIGFNHVMGFFQCDDMGYKSSTLISPELLKKYVLPWHEKASNLAHANGLLFCLHSCGNIENIMDVLIKNVKIDAKHSFEDAIMPVVDFKKKHGINTGVIGGVDMDKLCRLEEETLRKYLRKLLDECVSDGGYIFGSGNSIPSYVPLENYLIMLEEARHYFKNKKRT